MQRNAKITFGGSAPSCFASVSWPLTAPQADSSGLNVIRVDTEAGVSHFLSVIGGGGSGGHKQGDKDQLRIHSKLGRALGLQEGQIVGVSPYSGTLTPIRSANVVCVSGDDWEILESNTEAVINGLLNQLRVVYPGQKFPFWVTKSLQINLKIESLDPFVKDFGILTENSEITVPSLSSQTHSPFTSTSKLFRLRIHPTWVPDSVLCSFPTSSLLLKNTRNTFVFRKSLATKKKTTTDDPDLNNCDPYFHAQILLARNGNVWVGVKVFIIELSGINPELLKYFPITNPNCIYLHPELIREFDIEVKSHLWIQDMQGKNPSLEEGDGANQGKICPLGNNDEDLTLRVDSSIKVFDSLLKDCQYFIEESLSLECESHQLVGPNNGSLLIEGKTGSGKTWTCTTLSKTLEGAPYFIYCEIVSCSKWRGKKPETMETVLKALLEKAGKMQPSLLILDDLDVITPVGMSQQENLQEQFLHFKVCETIRECLLAYSGQQLCVIATAKSREVLNPYWKSRQGFHFFHKTVFIPPPNAVERLHIFEDCLTRYKLSPDKISSMKNDTNLLNLLKSIHDQYATPRLIAVVARKFVAASFTDTSRGGGQEFSDLNNLILDEIKFCDMEGGKNNRNEVPGVKWDDVGGLDEIKKDLVKILQWPIKHKKFFKNSPIKLPSGILFFGYPGTGKTLLGLAIPSLVNTKFIHIKGPELLSKYIGQSEQAVQDVFKRARNSSPCVIFFDEFDSLVPRRGHDSTGVTDRVVNQFLAEMDGIEGGLGQGVYLVGATSRPDLIDPAVLRPGRLDKHLFFDLPAKGERQKILAHLGAQVNLDLSSSPELDLLTDKMKGLTGADIQSLVCSAQLSAVQDYLGKLGIGRNNASTSEQYTSTLGNKDLTPSDIPVKVSHLLEAFSSFRPSLHGEELARFRNIYDTFSTGGSGDTRQQIPSSTGKRATLA